MALQPAVRARRAMAQLGAMVTACGKTILANGNRALLFAVVGAQQYGVAGALLFAVVGVQPFGVAGALQSVAEVTLLPLAQAAPRGMVHLGATEIVFGRTVLVSADPAQIPVVVGAPAFAVAEAPVSVVAEHPPSAVGEALAQAIANH